MSRLNIARPSRRAPRLAIAAAACFPLKLARPTRRRGQDTGRALDRDQLDRDHPDFVGALARGLAVIEAFDSEHRTLTLTEVAARTGLSRGTARRFLLTLASLGYAASDGRAFRLLPRVLRLGYGYLSALDLSEIGQPIVQALSARLGESCSLAVLDGEDIAFVARAEARRNYRFALTIGGRLPAHASSLGRVLLAGLPDPELDRFLENATLRPITPRTTTDKAVLRAAIMEARSAGFATVDDELQIGIRSVSVPVRDRDGTVIAALNVGALTPETSFETMRTTYLPLLRAAAAAIGGHETA
jgi:IclR family transcriptional regulator, pca regulon regulatory protein